MISLDLQRESTITCYTVPASDLGLYMCTRLKKTFKIFSLKRIIFEDSRDGE